VHCSHAFSVTRSLVKKAPKKIAIFGFMKSLALAIGQLRRSVFLTMKNSILPDLYRPGFIPGDCTYSAVQICGTTSPALQQITGPNEWLRQLAGRVMATVLGVSDERIDEMTRWMESLTLGIAAEASVEAISRAAALA